MVLIYETIETFRIETDFQGVALIVLKLHIVCYQVEEEHMITQVMVLTVVSQCRPSSVGLVPRQIQQMLLTGANLCQQKLRGTTSRNLMSLTGESPYQKDCVTLPQRTNLHP